MAHVRLPPFLPMLEVFRKSSACFHSEARRFGCPKAASERPPQVFFFKPPPLMLVGEKRLVAGKSVMFPYFPPPKPHIRVPSSWLSFE